MNISIFLLTLLFLNNATATVWITIGDAKTNKIGAIGASSGPIGSDKTLLYVENHAVAVVGGYVLGRYDQYLYDLLSGPFASVQDLTTAFSARINRDSYPRRVSVVTSQFEAATVAEPFCHEDNEYCGEQVGGHFTIAGGGLESAAVIAAANDVLIDPAVQAQPLECQMYQGIKAIFNAGGEILYFNRIAFYLDDVTKVGDERHFVFYRRGEESSLLEQLHEQFLKEGYSCGI